MMQHVVLYPGSTVSEISSRTGTPISTVRYQLWTLAQEGEVLKSNDNNDVRHYPAAKPLDKFLSLPAPESTVRPAPAWAL